MIEIEGRIGVREQASAAAELSKRLYGWRRYGFLIYLVVMAGQIPAGMSLGRALDIPAPWMAAGLLTTVIATMVIYIRWCRTLLPNACRRLGAAEESDARITADDTGLRIQGGIDMSVPWTGVLMIAPSKTAWLFMIGGMACFAPRRFFADKAAERAFVAYCLQRIPPEARARSREAVAFVG